MRFSTDYPVRTGAWIEPAAVTRVARAVESAGFSGLGFTDHPAPSGKWLERGGHETFDPFAAMAFCAAVTSRITLMSHLLVVPYRNPLLQASSMASVDVLAAGRTIFVLGTGYLRSEFAALGVDFDERNELFDEAVDVIRAFCTGESLEYEGRHFNAVGQQMRPVPVQRPHPPLWLGGNSSRTLDRVARWGQGWSVLLGSETLARTSRTRAITSERQLGEAIDLLLTRALELGRSPDEIAIQASSPELDLDAAASVEQRIDAVGRLAELGVSWLHVGLGSTGVDAAVDRLGEFGESVISTAG